MHNNRNNWSADLLTDTYRRVHIGGSNARLHITLGWFKIKAKNWPFILGSDNWKWIIKTTSSDWWSSFLLCRQKLQRFSPFPVTSCPAQPTHWSIYNTLVFSSLPGLCRALWKIKHDCWCSSLNWRTFQQRLKKKGRKPKTIYVDSSFSNSVSSRHITTAAGA